jgi:hypothetical protein
VFDIITMNANGYSHNHVLRTLGDTPIETNEI